MSLSIAIPTLGRDDVLIRTIRALLSLQPTAAEIIIIDQTDTHDYDTEVQLNSWDQEEKIRWIRIQYKSITRAMNIALRKATTDRVLFLDDDIIPDPDLVMAHINASSSNPEFIIAGRVLQPWHQGKADEEDSPFLFNSLVQMQTNSFMAGNVSIPRRKAIKIGGFDTNFVRVAYHFEAEFSYRWIGSGNKILFEPRALIHHLKANKGGTRSYGNHLTTIKPDHTVGRHYFYLCCNQFHQALIYSIRDIGKSIVTKHHLRNPVWIPISLFAEVLGVFWAIVLFQSGRGTIAEEKENLLIISSHPIQYYSPIYKKLNQIKEYSTSILYLTIPDEKSQALGFQHNFSWDIPLLSGYDYYVSKSQHGKGLRNGFFGIRISKPLADLSRFTTKSKPDTVLITGWHFWGMVQLFLAAKISNIPIILRMDSNALHQRIMILKWLYKLFFSWVDICLAVGTLNSDFYLQYGVDDRRIIKSPHVVDNHFFRDESSNRSQSFQNIRKEWNIPNESFCFLFAGKLQAKKRPFDILNAFKIAYLNSSRSIHLLIVGTGPLEDHCKKHIKNEDLPVSFAGFLNQTEIPSAYAVSDCIILASDERETWGLVINEAMACGLPAIVSNSVGCGSDLVFDDLTGYRYKCSDVFELSNKMIKISSNPQKARSMGKNAQKLLARHYTLEHVAASINLAMRRLNG